MTLGLGLGFPRTMVPVAVFGSSLPRESHPAYELARDLGGEIARRGGSVLCGGYGGVMEAACRGAVEAGGQAVGVVLTAGGEPNPFLTRRVLAEDLASRLRRLRDDAGSWIFLPRGLGTMLELVFVAESIVKAETTPRPLVLLGEFWSATLDKAIAEASGADGARALRSCAKVVTATRDAAVAALPE